MPRLFVSCRNCTRLRSQIQLADQFLMEEFIVLRFYGSTINPPKNPIHIIEMIFTLDYVQQMESINELFYGQKKKSIFAFVPFSFGGFIFERKRFNVAHKYLKILNLDVVIYQKYGPLKIVQKRLINNRNYTSKYEHEEKTIHRSVRINHRQK